jgi:hypothetical protein
MAQKSIEDRLSQLDSQRKTLQARLIKQERAKDTRRKILLGALVSDRISENHDKNLPLVEWLRRELPSFLKREDDKALFADLLFLPPGSSTETGPTEAIPAPPTLSD